ncbi:MAG TPA: HAD family phosphatase [Alphaproteobacteria bacterium]|nr:HAD family phosphatase [Alphaproteobacteria bacterium]
MSASPDNAPAVTTVVFDVGGVLLDWDPRYLYRHLLPDDAAVEHFLSTVCTNDWNLRQDAGRLWDEAVAELTAQHPHHAELIAAYHHRWPEMLNGAIQGTVDILEALRAKGTPLYAITNFSTEKWALAQEMFPFLRGFRGVTVSGVVKLIKPDPAIYRHFFDSFGVDPATAVFIDDNPANVVASQEAGMRAIRFRSPEQLRAELLALGLL